VSKYEDYERDEVIRQSKKKAKPKTKKSDHKHVYEDRYVPAENSRLNIAKTEKVCSLCGRVGETRYHWRMYQD
jgi:predicted Fe-S protein YdhL (DUF1289 family)